MRMCLYGALIIVGFVAPWWTFFPLATAYLFRYVGFELLLLGVVLDVSFGIHVSFVPFPFWYTGSLALLLVFATLFKPYMKFSSSL